MFEKEGCWCKIVSPGTVQRILSLGEPFLVALNPAPYLFWLRAALKMLVSLFGDYFGQPVVSIPDGGHDCFLWSLASFW